MKGTPVPKNRVVKRGLHGTQYDLTEVRPSSEHGNRQWDMSSKTTTYFVPSPDQKEYDEWSAKGAWEAPPELSTLQERAENQAWTWALETLSYKNRPRVYVTEPQGKQFYDRNIRAKPQWRDELISERVAPSQKVVDTIWGPPAPHDGHTRMTLPHINWKQFGAPNYQVVRPNGTINDLDVLPQVQKESPSHVERLDKDIPEQLRLF